MALPILWEIMTQWLLAGAVQGLPNLVTPFRVAPPTITRL
jgi:hypothetical protein